MIRDDEKLEIEDPNVEAPVAEAAPVVEAEAVVEAAPVVEAEAVAEAAPVDDDDDTDDTDADVIPFNDTPEDVLLRRIESLVFVHAEALTVRRLAQILSLERRRVRELLHVLMAQYADRGIQLIEVAGGFRFATHPDCAEVVRHITAVRPLKMSRPALETLAIVAYKQPCTRADIEDVRRVDCGATLKFLFERNLIRVLGRKEEPGRPMIYGTSSDFLTLFNLKSLSELPSLREFTELWEEHQLLVDEETESPEEMPAPHGGTSE
ncbi:MAG: SMC-Scp complex subunit ScpB [Proteobacteria bacterium]|nr:SMC-Scp complex subunit ScpB [Pseudomonadota bacterium]